MDQWIDVARGPMFRVAITIFVLGAVYRVSVMVVQAVRAWRRAGDRRLPWAEVATVTASWLLPVRMIQRRPAAGLASLALHLGVVIAPLFLAGHVALLLGPGSAWPTLPAVAADVATVLGVAGAFALIALRLASRTGRALTRTAHVVQLLVLAATLAAGFVAAHPLMSPVGARAALLVHILLGNLVLIMIPTTRIAHCLLAPFTRFVFEIGWHFPAESGRHVAQVLAREESVI